ncbi:MAG: amino acid racemase [Trueperaceae bacterium]|nr:amino acid racemase [Trueperaceae bacterium]
MTDTSSATSSPTSNSAPKTTKTVGVLGGMGPAATLDFFSKLLAKSKAVSDQGNLRVLIDNNPKVPNRNEAVAGTGPSPGPVLAEMAGGLEHSGADFLVMACNAAHAFVADILEAVSVPFVSMIDETVAFTREHFPDATKIGVLGSSGALDAKLYHHAFAEHGVTVVAPENGARHEFMQLLYQIKAGDLSDDVRGQMATLAANLVAEGADVVIAGCTEVPLVLLDDAVSVPLIDSTDVLVDATIAYATGLRALPGR